MPCKCCLRPPGCRLHSAFQQGGKLSKWPFFLTPPTASVSLDVCCICGACFLIPYWENLGCHPTPLGDSTHPLQLLVSAAKVQPQCGPSRDVEPGNLPIRMGRLSLGRQPVKRWQRPRLFKGQCAIWPACSNDFWRHLGLPGYGLCPGIHLCKPHLPPERKPLS